MIALSTGHFRYFSASSLSDLSKREDSSVAVKFFSLSLKTFSVPMLRLNTLAQSRG